MWKEKVLFILVFLVGSGKSLGTFFALDILDDQSSSGWHEKLNGRGQKWEEFGGQHIGEVFKEEEEPEKPWWLLINDQRKE